MYKYNFYILSTWKKKKCNICVNMYFKNESEAHGQNFIMKANEIAKFIKVKEISSSDEAGWWPIR